MGHINCDKLIDFHISKKSTYVLLWLLKKFNIQYWQNTKTMISKPISFWCTLIYLPKVSDLFIHGSDGLILASLASLNWSWWGVDKDANSKLQPRCSQFKSEIMVLQVCSRITSFHIWIIVFDIRLGKYDTSNWPQVLWIFLYVPEDTASEYASLSHDVRLLFAVCRYLFAFSLILNIWKV